MIEQHERSVTEILAYIEDQSEQFKQCAERHSDRENRGAEDVAMRANEVLRQIANLIKAANIDDKPDA